MLVLYFSHSAMSVGYNINNLATFHCFRSYFLPHCKKGYSVCVCLVWDDAVVFLFCCKQDGPMMNSKVVKDLQVLI